MQAKQTRLRHFKSSVGTLLNENYGALTNKKRPPFILSTAPACPNAPLSPKTPEISTAPRPRTELAVYETAAVSGLSDLQSSLSRADHGVLDCTHRDSEDAPTSLTPKSFGNPKSQCADSQPKKKDGPPSQLTLYSRSTEGPTLSTFRYAEINRANTSSRRQTCTPKSDRSLPHSTFRVSKLLGIPEDQINWEVPRYYDVNKHMFDLTPKRGSSRFDDVIVEQDITNPHATPERSDITWPRIIRQNEDKYLLKRCSTSRSSKVSSARSHTFSNVIFRPSRKPNGLSENISPEFKRSKSATNSTRSNLVSSGSRSLFGQQDNYANCRAKMSRSSASYDDTRLLLEVKMQHPEEWYTGHTPTHTPTPDSSLRTTNLNNGLSIIRRRKSGTSFAPHKAAIKIH